jgi:exodeoxyribonuclease VII small subunit
VLDQGNASLNDMMSLYEEGMTLIVSCKKTLDEAEQKLTVLGAL